jgi:hypothetical protein
LEVELREIELKIYSEYNLTRKLSLLPLKVRKTQGESENKGSEMYLMAWAEVISRTGVHVHDFLFQYTGFAQF